MVAPLAPLDARSWRGATSTRGPWTTDEVARLVVANAVGFAVVVAGAFETTISDDVLRTRLSWLQVSVLGLVIAAVANGMWLLRVRTTLVLAREAVLDPAHRAWLAGPVAAAAQDGSTVLVAGDGMTRYHRASCQLVAGRATRARTRAEHEREGLSPCEVCEP
jgi:hypothetical protein